MAKLGAFEYPDTSLDDAIEMAKKVAKQFKGQDIPKEALATCLGYENASSGTFGQRVADLRRYGVLEGRGKGLRASEAAKALLYPDPGEYEKTVASMVLRIPLIKALYDHYQGETPTTEDLAIQLRIITGAEREDIARQVPRVRSLFTAANSIIGRKVAEPSGGISPAAAPQKSQDEVPPMEIQSDRGMAPLPSAGPLQQGFIELRDPDGHFYARVKNDPKAIKRLKKLVDVYLDEEPHEGS